MEYLLLIFADESLEVDFRAKRPDVPPSARVAPPLAREERAVAVERLTGDPTSVGFRGVGHKEHTAARHLAVDEL
jgi:hypothetical protein